MQKDNKENVIKWTRKSDSSNKEKKQDFKPRIKKDEPKLTTSLKKVEPKKLKEGNFLMAASCQQNLEDVLAEELKALGAENIKIGRRAVEFSADLKLMYKANICLRTALRILKPLYTFTAKNEDQLYANVKKIEWEKIFSKDKTFAIDFAVHSEFFEHSQFASLKMKDAIVDRFRELFGERPSVDKLEPDVRLHLRISNEKVTISQDSSGAALFKRGYRRAKHLAPINETLAAGMLLKSGWRGESNFMDPMCGSGTIAIEAAMLAKNMAPNIHRENFGFEKWNNFEPKLLIDVLSEAKNQEKEIDIEIIARDKNSQSIRAARENIHAAGLSKVIRLEQLDMFRSTKPFEEGVMMINPPYGERIQLEDAAIFYATIGDSLKHDYTGITTWIISTEEELVKNIGLKPSQKIDLINGNIECKFVKFETFEGKRKDMLSQSE